MKPGGALLAGFLNPSYYLFEHDTSDPMQGLQVKYKLPYSDLDHQDEPAVQARLQRGEAVEFSHTLDDLIGGQARAGLMPGRHVRGWLDRRGDAAEPLQPHLDRDAGRQAGGIGARARKEKAPRPLIDLGA